MISNYFYWCLATYYKTAIKNVACLEVIVHAYCAILDQIINLSKSEIMISPKTPFLIEGQIRTLAQMNSIIGAWKLLGISLWLRLRWQLEYKIENGKLCLWQAELLFKNLCQYYGPNRTWSNRLEACYVELHWDKTFPTLFSIKKKKILCQRQCLVLSFWYSCTNCYDQQIRERIQDFFCGGHSYD